jgi:hypothetical protein
MTLIIGNAFGIMFIVTEAAGWDGKLGPIGVHGAWAIVIGILVMAISWLYFFSERKFFLKWIYSRSRK